VITRTHVVETNKPNDPVQIGSFGVNGVVVQTEYLSDLIKEFWLLTFLSNQAYKISIMIA